MIEAQIDSCPLFAEGKCPNQLLMERIYLFPQILTPEQLEEYENLCCLCTKHSYSSKKKAV